MLFLHGFMGNIWDFREVISYFSEDFNCLAVDLPGHGKTKVIGEEDCYNMPNTAKALIQLLDDLELETCFLVGYSMGGRLALYMTVHFPSRFTKVVLESASPGLRTQEARSHRQQADLILEKKLETGDFHEFVLSWYNQPLFRSLKNHPEWKNLIERRLENNPAELAKSLRHLGTGNQPPLWEKLVNNQIPMLLLAGEYDDKFKTINAEMASLCQSSQLKIISKSGHNIHWENFTDYTKALSDFCNPLTS